MFDRALGLARSIAIYHAIPFRQPRLRHLYRNFVHRGDVVFDVGAHAGNHVRALRALGCRVIAVEPQPDFVGVLRLLFGRSAAVTIVETAVGDRVGRATLSISERTPTVTSLSSDWREARAGDADFAGVRWNRSTEVEVTTLDALIERFGLPSFVKLDVEGSEPAALAGLSQPIPAVAFEYLPQALERVSACVQRLGQLDSYVYNWSPGESHRLATKEWTDGAALLDALHGQRRSGDVYARRMPATSI
jgi:FkbM family methyltransferase